MKKKLKKRPKKVVQDNEEINYETYFGGYGYGHKGFKTRTKTSRKINTKTTKNKNKIKTTKPKQKVKRTTTSKPKTKRISTKPKTKRAYSPRTRKTPTYKENQPKSRKPKTTTINITNLVLKRSIKDLDINKVKRMLKTNTNNLIKKGGQGGYVVDYAKKSNRIIKALSKGKLSSRQKDTLIELLNEGGLKKKGDNYIATFNNIKNTNITSLLERNFTKEQEKELKKIGFITKGNLKIVEQSTRRQTKQNKLGLWYLYNHLPFDIQEIINSMGGLVQALEKYPDIVARLYMDHLGVDIYDYKTNDDKGWTY